MRRKWVAIGGLASTCTGTKPILPSSSRHFCNKVAWANERQLPVVIHSRESFAEIIELLDRQPRHRRLGSSIASPERSNKRDKRSTAVLPRHRRCCHLQKIRIGCGGGTNSARTPRTGDRRSLPCTDPHRGKRNLPEYVYLVAEKIAEIKGVTIEEVAKVTTENTNRIFGI